MTKVIFNNEEIDLIDNLDPGEEEFDLNTPEEIDLDKTLVLKIDGENNDKRPEN